MASRLLFAAIALVVGLLVGSGAAYVVYAGQVSSIQSSLNQANENNSMLHQELQNATFSQALQLQTGAMIHSGWIFISWIGGGDYAVSIHAEGLEPPSMGAYIVEGVTRQSMNMVPLSGNATSSEFEAGTDGMGNYWTTLMQYPSSTYKAVDLVFLPGMDMTHATVVATVQLG